MGRRVTVILAMSVLSLVAWELPAEASTTGPHTSSASVDTCVHGSFWYDEGGHLSNGHLSTGVCLFKTGALGTASTSYTKSGGSPVTVRLGYRWTDSDGNIQQKQHWGDWFTQSVGTEWLQRWSFDSPGENQPSSNAYCWQGDMQTQGSNGEPSGEYYTKTICPY